MANDINITVHGNLTADPELRYTQAGVAVANLTIAQTPRFLDKTSNEWKDGEAVFLRGAIWRGYGEHVAASLRKGQAVIASGKLRQRSYVDPKTSENRTVFELDIDEIGPSLRYGTSVFTKSTPGASNAAAPAPAAAAAPAPAVAPAAPAAPAPAAPQVAEVQF